jgi:hypothetical protein
MACLVEVIWGAHLNEALVQAVDGLQRVRVGKRQRVGPEADDGAVFPVEGDV